MISARRSRAKCVSSLQRWASFEMSVDNFNCAPFFSLAFAVFQSTLFVALSVIDLTLVHENKHTNSEIAELMAVKSKHGAGGEYSPNWTPPVSRCYGPRLSRQSHALKYLDLGFHPSFRFRPKNHLPHLQRRSPLHPLMTVHPSKPDQHGRSYTNRHDGREHPRASPPPSLRPCQLSRLPNRICLLGLSGDVRAACRILVTFFDVLMVWPCLANPSVMPPATVMAPGPVSPRPMTPAARPGLFGASCVCSSSGLSMLSRSSFLRVFIRPANPAPQIDQGVSSCMTRCSNFAIAHATCIDHVMSPSLLFTRP